MVKLYKKTKLNILTQNLLNGLRKIKLWWIFIVLLLPIFAVVAALNPTPMDIPSHFKSKTIDEEVKKMIDVAYARTKQILTMNKEKLSLLANKLLEKEVIFKEDLEEIFGVRKWGELEKATFNSFTENGELKTIAEPAPTSNGTPDVPKETKETLAS